MYADPSTPFRLESRDAKEQFPEEKKSAKSMSSDLWRPVAVSGLPGRRAEPALPLRVGMARAGGPERMRSPEAAAPGGVPLRCFCRDGCSGAAGLPSRRASCVLLFPFPNGGDPLSDAQLFRSVYGLLEVKLIFSRYWKSLLLYILYTYILRRSRRWG